MSDLWSRPWHWPRDTKTHTFLARAAEQVGKHLFQSSWTGAEPTLELPASRPPPLEMDIEKRRLAGLRATFTLADLMADEQTKRSAPDLEKEKLVIEGVFRWQSVVQKVASALADGDLKSAVRPTVGGTFEPVPKDVWNTEFFWQRFQEFQLLDGDISRFGAVDPRPCRGWIYVENLSLSKWLGHPKKTPTGAQGRPSLMPVVEAELLKRGQAGKIEVTLAAQARALAEWFKDVHPNELPIKASSIVRALRHEYHAARSRSQDSEAGK